MPFYLLGVIILSLWKQYVVLLCFVILTVIAGCGLSETNNQENNVENTREEIIEADEEIVEEEGQAPTETKDKSNLSDKPEQRKVEETEVEEDAVELDTKESSVTNKSDEKPSASKNQAKPKKTSEKKQDTKNQQASKKENKQSTSKPDKVKDEKAKKEPPKQERKERVTVSVSVPKGVKGPNYGPTEIEIEEGSSVYDALLKTGLSIGANTIGGVYVYGIDGLEEFHEGPMSGWKYKVDGNYPNVGAGSTILRAGQKIEWIYTTDYTND